MKKNKNRTKAKKSISRVSRTTVHSSKWQVAPLKASFMVIAILGLLVTAYIVYPQSRNFGVAFLLVFIAMFIASLISMTKAPIIAE